MFALSHEGRAMAAGKTNTGKNFRSRSGPDRDTDGQVRVEIIEDRDPQNASTWHSFQIMSTVRVPGDEYGNLQHALGEPTESAVRLLQRVNASPQMIALYRAAKAKGTGGVPNLLLTADYGGVERDNFFGRFTIHTEVFLATSDPQAISDLWSRIAQGDVTGIAQWLNTFGYIASALAYQSLLRLLKAAFQ